MTTTIETWSIQDYPFPAVTFYPGDFNSQNAFLKDFLNEFEFTRFGCYESFPLCDNEKFMALYEWLLAAMNDELFDDTEKYIIDHGLSYSLYLQTKEKNMGKGRNSKYQCPIFLMMFKS